MNEGESYFDDRLKILKWCKGGSNFDCVYINMWSTNNRNLSKTRKKNQIIIKSDLLREIFKLFPVNIF